MPNRLANSTSPYLLQHADNPVDWHEWGEEAFALARLEDRPVFLSIGYSACHWCHVMAHESFEDSDTADIINERFVAIKVDREERPDVDRIYMEAVQAMSGHGGWPMTVFLAPDGRPFFAGTYYPPIDQPNYPSLRRVMDAVHDAWTTRRQEIDQQASELSDAIGRSLPPSPEVPGAGALAPAYESFASSFDETNGGFGGAPKFPQAPTLEYLLRVAGEDWAPGAKEMLEITLEKMARGGIYDQLGGGFARYAVDDRWLVPHFEKMLYDNALLARVYLRAWQVTGNDLFRTVATETLDYMLADLGQADGGFSSAEDADSEGEEGKFYVWTFDELTEAAGDAAAIAAVHFGVTAEGNFEGSNVLTALPISETAGRLGIEPDEARETLAVARLSMLATRLQRVRPGLDDKVVAAWNGLALRALAEAGAVLDEARYIEAAKANADFVLSRMRRADGRLLRSWRLGKAEIPAFCEDYAALALGLFALYEATGALSWYVSARQLVSDMIDLFSDDGHGGFFTTGHDAEELISRPKELQDNPTPSANAMAAEALLRLAAYTGDDELHQLADRVFQVAGSFIERYPNGVGHLLAVLHTRTSAPKELALIGKPDDATMQRFLKVTRERFRPGCYLAIDWGDGAAAVEIPLLDGKTAAGGGATAYVCEGFVCRAPTDDPIELAEQLVD